MNAIVELSFRHTQTDYVRAYRAHQLSVMRLPMDIAVTLLMLAMGGYLWRDPATQGYGIFCVIIAALFTLMLLAALYVIPPMVYRSDPKLQDEYHLTFSDEGIRFRTSKIDSQLQWSLYDRALIVGHAYILYHGKRQMTVLPRRYFASLEQQQEFESLLSRHIPKIVQKK